MADWEGKGCQKGTGGWKRGGWIGDKAPSPLRAARARRKQSTRARAGAARRGAGGSSLLRSPSRTPSSSRVFGICPTKSLTTSLRWASRRCCGGWLPGGGGCGGCGGLPVGDPGVCCVCCCGAAGGCCCGDPAAGGGAGTCCVGDPGCACCACVGDCGPEAGPPVGTADACASERHRGGQTWFAPQQEWVVFPEGVAVGAQGWLARGSEQGARELLHAGETLRHAVLRGWGAGGCARVPWASASVSLRGRCCSDLLLRPRRPILVSHARRSEGRHDKGTGDRPDSGKGRGQDLHFHRTPRCRSACHQRASGGFWVLL